MPISETSSFSSRSELEPLSHVTEICGVTAHSFNGGTCGRWADWVGGGEYSELTPRGFYTLRFGYRDNIYSFRAQIMVYPKP